MSSEENSTSMEHPGVRQVDVLHDGDVSEDASNGSTVSDNGSVVVGGLVEPVNVPVIVCELLCYAAFHLQRCAPDNIKKILMSSFTADEIYEAKKLLWCEHYKPHLKKFQERKTTQARHCSEAHLNDIFDTLLDLDTKTDLPRVKFVAVNLLKLPNVNPEELNELALLKKIELLERKFEVLEGSVLSNSQRCDKADEQLSTHGRLMEELAVRQVNVHECGSSTVTATPSEVEEAPPTDATGDSDGWETVSNSSDSSSGEEDESDEEADDSSSSSSDGDDAVSVSGASYASVTSLRSRSSRCCSCCACSVKSDDRQSGGRPDMQQHNEVRSRHLKPVVTGNSTRLGAAWPSQDASRHGSGNRFRNRHADANGFQLPRGQRRRQNRSSVSLFVFNVPNSCSAVTLKDYADEHGVKVLEVFQRSHPEARRKSFVLRVPSGVEDRLLKPSFWPSGIKVREYDLKGHKQ